MLTGQNIESELSYAHLHAVAARGGFSCQSGSRHEDNAGVDAVVRSDGRKLAPDSTLTMISLDVQLKATTKRAAEQNGKFSHSLTVPHYNKLRCTTVLVPRILVVLYLPENAAEWLCHSEDGLITKRCAYWVSLHGAPESENPKHQTVYIPRKNVLSVDGLTELMTQASRREAIRHEA